jgi:CheY-like chemotaxis protein
MREKASFPGSPASIAEEQGRILVIAEDPWARDTMRVLLSSMGCSCVMASSVQQARATIGQEKPDAAIVDAHRATSASLPELSGLAEICVSLRGRVVVLTNEGYDSEVAALIQRFNLPRIRRERLLQDLWGTLDSLLRPNSLFRRVIHAARLIFDSFLQPAPEGIRASQLAGRRFVYEAGSVMVDLSLEPPLTDSRRISLVGQLMDSAGSGRQLDIHAVSLRGSKGPIALASTNKFGEFQFEFDFEPNVQLEIETAANQWVSVVLPRLEWLEKGFEGAH